MKRWNPRPGIFVALAGLTAVVPSAYAEQPPDVVESDDHGNTASGSLALSHLDVTSGTALSNSAFGYQALLPNSTGHANTAVGAFSLLWNTTGSGNVATGAAALAYNTSGSQDVAIGDWALGSNSAGNNNTAVGSDALYSCTADDNTAGGVNALTNDTTGANNTAFGYYALLANTTGKGNEALGVKALLSNTTGIRNLAMGSNALYGNVSGSYNVAMGFNAGYYQATGNDNIYIANQGVADESQTLRLGAQGTAGTQGSGILSAYVAGVATSQVTGSAVYVTPSGQLGVLASSERFKTDVESMGAASEKLARLRPVTFKLKSDLHRTQQYGLIAEEVAKVYPELVIRGANGRIDGVRYEELVPMLLNGAQHQQAQLAARARQADAETQVIRNLEARVEQADTQASVIRSLAAQIAHLSQFKQSMMTTLRQEQPQRITRLDTSKAAGQEQSP